MKDPSRMSEVQRTLEAIDAAVCQFAEDIATGRLRQAEKWIDTAMMLSLDLRRLAIATSSRRSRRGDF